MIDGPRPDGRDPERIPLVLAAVERQWRKHPDMRLGQLVVALLRTHATVPREDEGSALFALSDGRLLDWLGVDTDAERRYVAEEPDREREAWRRRQPRAGDQ